MFFFYNLFKFQTEFIKLNLTNYQFFFFKFWKQRLTFCSLKLGLLS